MSPFNPHPPLVAFPLALILTSALLEVGRLTRWRERCGQAAEITLSLAAFFVVMAFLSGYQASELAGELAPQVQEHVAQHHALGRLLLIAIFPTCFLAWLRSRATHARGVFAGLYLLALAVCVVLVVLTGWEGGELVFEHAVGVRQLSP